MRFFLFGLCVFFSAVCGAPKEIELFMDWRSDAKGQEVFPLVEGQEWKHLSLPSRIRTKLVQKGWDIRSWEKAEYLPWILGWKGVHTWREFLWWAGFGLLRPQPMKDSTQYWVFWSLGPTLSDVRFTHLPKDKMVLFMWEPCVVQPESHDLKVHACFGKIFTWDDDLVDNVKYFKFYYPVLRDRIAEVVPFEEKKFCTLINGRLCSKHPKQLYGEREKVIRFFEDKPGEFDLYGKFWEKRNYKNYLGPAANKFDVLKNYKFCISYENTRDVRGYVTEKIFDCFATGVVPVYWGASNICDYVPANCFVDRRKFGSEQELYDFLKAMTKETYEEYVRAAEVFLKSPQAKLFSEDHFVETFLQLAP